jgi:hypothetical protein
MGGGGWGIVPLFLTSALDWSEWSASHPRHFTPRETAPCTHWVGGWVGPRASLDTMEKRRISCPCQELNPSHQPVTVLTGLSVLQSLRSRNLKSGFSCTSVCITFSLFWASKYICEGVISMPHIAVSRTRRRCTKVEKHIKNKLYQDWRMDS